MTEISKAQVKNQKFGISQGRLTKSEQLQRFPSEDWQAEFYNAQKVGINFIELFTIVLELCSIVLAETFILYRVLRTQTLR